ncbi:isochorismatase family protein [Dactylosporangium sp. NPDC049525]|uniref:isochorismatase family protein n=1 Tax=Dactylosporangium sp. NPDC049525 TaxID=3154730 RepID=UPI0034475834
MAIPPITAYAMPEESELPASVAGWRPDPARAVLLIHDMQRYFVNFFPPGELVDRLVANIARLKRTMTALGMPVMYTAQPGAMTREDRGLLFDVWGKGMDATPADRQVVDGIAPAPNDVILTKWRYSAFHRSPLEELLSSAGRDQLIVCGVYAHVGCLMTVSDAFSRDIQPFLVADAVADFTAEDHRMAIDYAARRCAVVASTTQILERLQEAPLQVR